MGTFKEIYSYRQMIYSMIRRDLRGRYKGTVLGFFWTFLNPLLQLAVYTVVFSTILKSDIDKYYLFLFVALIPWLFMSSCLTAGSTLILANESMVKKIYFPREILPVSFATSSFVNMLFCFIVIFAVVLISGVRINPAAVLCLPIIMLVEYILALAITMLASAVTVYFRDMQHILGILSMVWMYLTPVLYSYDIIPEEYAPIFRLNPMTPIIIAFRDILYYSRPPRMSTIIKAFLLAFICLSLAWCLFSKLKKRFAEEL